MSGEIHKGKFIENFYSIIALIVGVIFIIGLVGQEIMLSKDMPANMIVYVDESRSIYYAPPYIDGKKYPDNLKINAIKALTAAEAQNKKFMADNDCIELGYFEEKTTLTHNILVKLGLTDPNPSRWNPDGSWNW
ncbi:MAG: hypothetical protein PHF24_01320 [Syntrophomonas sp.]|nr:hypothetical protein [Syntrophomonas sp.]